MKAKIKYKTFTIPKGWVELEPGETISKEHKFCYTDTPLEGEKRYSRFINISKDNQRFSIGEKYSKVVSNGIHWHYPTIKKLPIVAPEFKITGIDDYFAYRISTNSVEQKNKLVDICVKYGLEDKKPYSAKEQNKNLDILISIKSNRINWNYPDHDYTKELNYGIPLDINNDIHKIIKVLEFTQNLHKKVDAPPKYKYSIDIKEVHTLNIEVEAANENEAKDLAMAKYQNNGLPDLEFSHTLPKEEWNVSKIE